MFFMFLLFTYVSYGTLVQLSLVYFKRLKVLYSC